MPWNYRRYGTASDPIHKSHLNAIVGDYGCPKQFCYAMDAQAAGVEGVDEQRTISGKAAAGTAAHETIARALTNLDVREHLLRGGKIAPALVRRAFDEELEREAGGRELVWYGKDEGRSAQVLDERVTMVAALLNGLHAHVSAIELLEAGFIARLGDYWLSGHIDLIYRPRAPMGVQPVFPTLGLADWKTGKVKPAPIELDHGWEAGVYSCAVRHGWFFPREQIRTSYTPSGTIAHCGNQTRVHASKYIAERRVLEAAMIDFAERTQGALALAANGNAADGGAPSDTLALDAGLYRVRTFERFPTEIFHVHLEDYVPYKTSGKKRVTRREDLEYYGYQRSEPAHPYRKGDAKGPAWLPVQLAEYDLVRLESRLRNVVGGIRMGRFIDQVGERCTRCAYASDCLTAGYVRAGDRQAIEHSLRVLAANDVDADALALSDE